MACLNEILVQSITINRMRMNEDKPAQSRVLLFFKPQPNRGRSRCKSGDYIQPPCLHPFLRHSFVPRQVQRGDTKQRGGVLSSAAERSSHERINISEEAIQCADPLVPVQLGFFPRHNATETKCPNSVTIE